VRLIFGLKLVHFPWFWQPSQRVNRCPSVGSISVCLKSSNTTKKMTRTVVANSSSLFLTIVSNLRAKGS
jgi:hypothetical protein